MTLIQRKEEEKQALRMDDGAILKCAWTRGGDRLYDPVVPDDRVTRQDHRQTAEQHSFPAVSTQPAGPEEEITVMQMLSEPKRFK